MVHAKLAVLLVVLLIASGMAAVGDSVSGATAPTGCLACAFGPREYVRAPGVPVEDRHEFPADPLADYIIDIDDLGTRGADGSVVVNGTVIMAPRTWTETGPRHIRQAIALRSTNRIDIRLTGAPESRLRVPWAQPGKPQAMSSISSAAGLQSQQKAGRVTSVMARSSSTSTESRIAPHG